MSVAERRILVGVHVFVSLCVRTGKLTPRMSFICVYASMLDWFVLLCMQGTKDTQQDISTTQKSIGVAPGQLRYPSHPYPLYGVIRRVLYSGKPWNGAPFKAGLSPCLPFNPWESGLDSLSLHFRPTDRNLRGYWSPSFSHSLSHSCMT